MLGTRSGGHRLGGPPGDAPLRREGDWWIGYGMATSCYPALRANAQARAR